MRKRFGALSLVCLLIVSIFGLLPLTASAKKNEIGQIVGNDVNLRKEPSQDSESLVKLSPGTLAEVLDTVDDPNSSAKWYHVSSKGLTGYVREDMLLIRSLSNRVGYVIADGANLRSDPGQSAPVKIRMAGGKPVTIQLMTGGWFLVKYQGIEGFVYYDLIELSKDQTSNDAYDMYLKFGMAGMAVRDLQNELVKRNFMDAKTVDGVYGNGTVNAIREFQKLAEIPKPDGVAGPTTIKALFDPNNKVKKAPKVPKSSNDFYGRVETVDWWKGGNKILRRPGGVCTVYDVKSGKSFKIRRTGGTNHNDCGPLTAADTAIFKSILGGRWSHDKRPIIVIVGSHCYAASIYCMPHGHQVIANNNYPGMLCIHFSNSRTHGGNRIDPLHKSNIQYVYNKYKDKKS